MRKDEFANKIIGITYQHWQMVLNGGRNLGLANAKLVSRVLGTDLETWINPEMKDLRAEAWKKFQAK